MTRRGWLPQGSEGYVEPRTMLSTSWSWAVAFRAVRRLGPLPTPGSWFDRSLTPTNSASRTQVVYADGRTRPADAHPSAGRGSVTRGGKTQPRPLLLIGAPQFLANVPAESSEPLGEEVTAGVRRSGAMIEEDGGEKPSA